MALNLGKKLILRNTKQNMFKFTTEE